MGWPRDGLRGHVTSLMGLNPLRVAFLLHPAALGGGVMSAWRSPGIDGVSGGQRGGGAVFRISVTRAMHMDVI